MLTFIHAADFHLDSPFRDLSPAQAAVRRGEQRELLKNLAALARERGADLVLLSGDLLDGENFSRETGEVFVTALGQTGCPVFIAPGNHDAYDSMSPYKSVRFPENASKITAGTIDLLINGSDFLGNAVKIHVIAPFSLEFPVEHS